MSRQVLTRAHHYSSSASMSSRSISDSQSSAHVEHSPVVPHFSQSGFRKVRVDSTNQDYIVEDMKNSGIDNVEGVRFSLPRKEEMATLLKQRMVNSQFWYPYFTWSKPCIGEWVTELNVERFELRKDGSIALNHPSGTHDDVFWATALALYGTVEMKPLDLEAFKFG